MVKASHAQLEKGTVTEAGKDSAGTAGSVHISGEVVQYFTAM